MSLHDLEGLKQKIVEHIKELDGEKAGKSQLGYISPRGRTFHLKIPTENKFKLISKLQTLGRIRVDKEKHWRKMPEGSSRILLSIENLDEKASW